MWQLNRISFLGNKQTATIQSRFPIPHSPGFFFISWEIPVPIVLHRANPKWKYTIKTTASYLGKLECCLKMNSCYQSLKSNQSDFSSGFLKICYSCEINQDLFPEGKLQLLQGEFRKAIMSNFKNVQQIFTVHKDKIPEKKCKRCMEHPHLRGAWLAQGQCLAACWTHLWCVPGISLGQHQQLLQSWHQWWHQCNHLDKPPCQCLQAPSNFLFQQTWSMALVLLKFLLKFLTPEVWIGPLKSGTTMHCRYIHITENNNSVNENHPLWATK